MSSCKVHRTVSWVFQWIAALILLQTLFFKFTGAPESRFIFTTLGVEPWGRIGTGLMELLAVGLLLWSRSAVLGALLSLGLMVGALASHLIKLGIIVQDDGGLLFALAITVLGSSAIVIWLRRYDLPYVGRLMFSGHQADCSLAPKRS